MKLTKVSNKSQVKNMQNMIKTLLGPSKDNKHIFFEKIFGISKQLADYDQLYTTVLRQYTGLPHIQSLLADNDREILDKIEKIRAETSAEFNGEQLNMLHLMKSQVIAGTEEAQITELSDYVNGLVQNTVIQRIIAFLSDCQKNYKSIVNKQGTFTLKELQSAFHESTTTIQSLKIFDHDIWQKVSDARFKDQLDTLQRTALLIQLLCKTAQKIYDQMVRPEIDVVKMKEMIEKSIHEFKKQVQGCDMAFQKLLKSLDIFVERFDKYYEKFLAEGKDPMVFFFEFIEDVKQQYSDTDSKHCRDILRQFKGIQQKFGEKIAGSINNPGVRDLYDQLCEQMSKAGKIIHMNDDDN